MKENRNSQNQSSGDRKQNQNQNQNQNYKKGRFAKNSESWSPKAGPSSQQSSNTKKNDHFRSHRNNNPTNNSQSPSNSRFNRRPPRRDDQRFEFHEIHKRWHELFTKHNLARKKYFDQYHKDADKRSNLEKEFHQACIQLRQFENELLAKSPHWWQAIFQEYPNELTYADNHGLDSKGIMEIDPSLKNFPDPHLTPTQHQRPSYAKDKEESSGTIEDYIKYKGPIEKK